MERSSFPFTQNRELSWLRFNERVLDEADRPEVEAYEKLKFISIFTSNLTEFFMVRVGSLTDISRLKKEYRDNKTGMTANEQLYAIMKMLPDMYKKKDKLYRKVSDELKEFGIHSLKVKELSEKQYKYIRKVYNDEFKPLLSPQIINQSHPFPFIENDKLHVILELVEDEDKVYAIVPIRTDFAPYIALPSDEFSYILTEKIILEFADDLFPKGKVSAKAIINVTRNFDLSEDEDIIDEFDDFRDYMKGVLKRRTRQQTVRLESNSELSLNLLSFLTEKLDLDPINTFVTTAPMRMKYVFSLLDEIPTAIKSKILFNPFTPYEAYVGGIAGSMIKLIESQDIMLSYPYDDMKAFLDLIKEAADDPRVISIKITIYRLAKNSKLVKYLCKAAENGVDVTAFMELRARFDEQNNINYSDILFDSGANIIYGIEKYKVHSKCCLITYKEGHEVKYITQVGTGNYNESTSKQYTDLSLITADKEIGNDASDFFRNLATGNVDGRYKHLLQSPSTFKPKLMKLIDDEIAKGEEGRLTFKMNSLTDLDFIKKFVEASRAGVKITLIIRGISCMLPDLADTKNIEIRSVVGRFLEHPRIYLFGKGNEVKIYISSADLMTRNTDRRVEVAAPIYNENLKKEIEDYLDIQLRDNVKGRRMNSQGEYELINDGKEPLNSQEYSIMVSDKRRAEHIKEKVNEDKKLSKKESGFFKKLGKLFKK